MARRSFTPLTKPSSRRFSRKASLRKRAFSYLRFAFECQRFPSSGGLFFFKESKSSLETIVLLFPLDVEEPFLVPLRPCNGNDGFHPLFLSPFRVTSQLRLLFEISASLTSIVSSRPTIFFPPPPNESSFFLLPPRFLLFENRFFRLAYVDSLSRSKAGRSLFPPPFFLHVAKRVSLHGPHPVFCVVVLAFILLFLPCCSEISSLLQQQREGKPPPTGSGSRFFPSFFGHR